MTEENTVTLTESETAFFESGGETAIVETPEVTTATTEPIVTPEVKQEQERDEKGKFVPHQALHAEREEHKKTRAELNEIRERQARLDERWNLMTKAQQEAETPKEEYPDASQDPLGAVDWVVQQLRQQKESQAKQQAEHDQQTQQEQQIRQVVEYVDHNYVEAVKTDPVVEEAYKAAFDSYARELQVIGYRGEAFNQKINETLRNFQWTAAQQMQQGVSLGDFIKSVAQTRGWQAKAADPVDPAKMELSEKLDGVAKAIDASKSLGQVTARAGADALSPQAIADMPAHEFEAWMKVPENVRRFNKLMGG